MSDTDVLKELVRKAAAGDKVAFEELYRMTCRSENFTCLGILKDEQEAQDTPQMSIWLSLNSWVRWRVRISLCIGFIA